VTVADQSGDVTAAADGPEERGTRLRNRSPASAAGPAATSSRSTCCSESAPWSWSTCAARRSPLLHHPPRGLPARGRHAAARLASAQIM